MSAEGDRALRLRLRLRSATWLGGGLRRQGGLTTEIHGYFAALSNLARGGSVHRSDLNNADLPFQTGF